MYNLEVMLKVVEKFLEEARNNFENKCYLSSLVFYGATLEAILLSMCFIYHRKVRKTQVYKRRRSQKKRAKKRGIFLEFTLDELIKIAEELKWFPMDDKIDDSSIFEDWVKWVHMTRNLIHPSRWLKPDSYFGNLNKIITTASKRELRKFTQLSEEIISGILEILSAKVAGNLPCHKMKNGKDK